MAAKATNLALLWLSLLAFASGVGSFLVGNPSGKPVLWLHATAGFSLLLLFHWKRRIIFRSLHRRGIGVWAIVSMALFALVSAVILSGIAWASVGLPAVGPYSGLTIHVALGGGVVLFLTVHAVTRWPRVRRNDLVGRRALLRSSLLMGAGGVAWLVTETAARTLKLDGSRRRFTGSRKMADSPGNTFPASSWLRDDPDPIDQSAWQLKVHGHVERPLILGLDVLQPVASCDAILDCTGGWYARRAWSGVSLGQLVRQAGIRPGAQSLVVRASTGYWRRYSLTEADRSLLATHVNGDLLTHAHGAPLRLVVPGKRGYEWVKWVTEVQVSTASPWLKWPLPIS